MDELAFDGRRHPRPLEYVAKCDDGVMDDLDVRGLAASLLRSPALASYRGP